MPTERRVQKMVCGVTRDGKFVAAQLTLDDGSEARLLFPANDMPRVIEQLEQTAGRAAAILRHHAGAEGRPMPVLKPARAATGYQASFAEDGTPVLYIQFDSGLQIGMTLGNDFIGHLIQALQMLRVKETGEPTH